MKYINMMSEWYHSMNSRDRLRLGIAVVVLLALALIFSAANDHISRLRKKVSAREADLAEMMVLKQRHSEASALALRLNNRLAATRPDDTPAGIIDEIGIKGKGSRIRPIKVEERGEFLEDSAQVNIDGVSANEAVNLFFRLEKGNKPVLVRKALLKTRFDDPSKLDLDITMALLKPSRGGR